MPSNIPKGQIYADIIIPSTIVVMSQPRGASTATMGGLMAARMNKLGAQGVLVDGRVRDVAQLTDSRFVHMPVWSRGVSAVATRGECKAHAVGMEVWVGKSRVRQGDLIMLDPEDRCAVCIPQDQVGAVLEMVEGIATADEVKMCGTVGDLICMLMIHGAYITKIIFEF
ncbi:hypothetical protein AtubIFM61612_010680 [Aspergillus tubingensis]|nr:hypothetical protein AtubIFM57143_007528 [Aspergillus tubingensis]GLB20736.1 hypothetical protein AtubIFM61612_010680 [Aspergillus tubingensis]